MTRLRSVIALSIVLLAGACRAGPDLRSPALIGFVSAVDTSVVTRAGATVLQVMASPPAVIAEGEETTFATLRRDPKVAFVEPLSSTDDSVRAFVEFVDRPLNTDTLSATDRAAIARAGAWIKYVYTDTPDIAAVVPRGGLAALRGDPAVSAVIDVGPPGHVL
jgi:hypothetical protein